MPEIVQAIVSSCRLHFAESTFKLNRIDYNRYEVSGDPISKAINHNKNSKDEVNVLHWFSDFWVYITISFIDREKLFPSAFISISIFQGDAEDSKKNQLFRAEWDSYEDNLKHPQPHWHIYPFKYDNKVYEDFEAFNDLKAEENSFEGFIKKNKVIDIRDMHFAMNAQWSTNNGHIHSASDADVILNWMQGVLEHIKYQLSFVKGQ